MKLIKILTTAFSFIILFQLFFPITLVLADEVKFTPQVSIPGSSFKANTAYTPGFDGTTRSIGEYIKAIYKYTIGIVGILAAVILMYGGVVWLTAGGSAERLGEAKAWIGASLTGLAIAMGSFLLLSTINPALTNLTLSPVLEINQTPPKDKKPSDPLRGCCETFVSDGRITCDPDQMEGACGNTNQNFSLGQSCTEAKCKEKLTPDTPVFVCCQKENPPKCSAGNTDCNFAEPGWVLIPNSTTCDPDNQYKTCKLN